jgi:hypothetical protein
MVYFIRETKKGLLVGEKNLSTKTVLMPDGSERQFRTQGGKLGFIACEGFDPKELNLEKGDELAFTITDKQVVSVTDKTPIPNLYWCTPE